MRKKAIKCDEWVLRSYKNKDVMVVNGKNVSCLDMLRNVSYMKEYVSMNPRDAENLFYRMVDNPVLGDEMRNLGEVLFVKLSDVSGKKATANHIALAAGITDRFSESNLPMKIAAY